MQRMKWVGLMVLICLQVVAVCGAYPLQGDQHFIVQFEQDGTMIAVDNHIVTLRPKPFTIVVTFPYYTGGAVAVRLKPDRQATHYDQAKNGENLSALAGGGIGIAESLFNPRQVLFLNEGQSVHYLFYASDETHRFSQVQRTDGGLVCKRVVARLLDQQTGIEQGIEQLDQGRLYLVFVATTNDQIVQQDYYQLQFNAADSMT